MNGRRFLIRGAGCICLVLVSLAATSRLQAQNRITGEGTHGFRALLSGKGLTPLEKAEEVESFAKEDPSHLLIVVFHGANAAGQPYEDPIETIQFDLRAFVDRGGALFVATDQRLDPRLAAGFRVAVDGSYVTTRAYPGFDGSFDCPYIARANRATPNLFQGPGGELNVVATNRPSCLEIRTDGPPVLAEFPAGRWHCDSYRNRERFGGSLPFAQGQSYANSGRFLLLADHSVFINSMMLPRGQLSNDNLQFASNCIDWLMFGEHGARTHVIFMEDGIVWRKKDYDLALQAMPASPDEVADYLWQNKDLLWKHPEVADAIASELEQSGIFQEIERADPFNAFLSRHVDSIVRALLIVGAVLLAGYALSSFARSRHFVSKRTPRLAMVLHQIRPRVGLLDQRVQSGIGRVLFDELARKHARDAFSELGLTPANGAPAPTFTIDAPWWQRRRVARDLRLAWAVAFSQEPVALSGRQREHWQWRLTRLASLIRDHAIRIG